MTARQRVCAAVALVISLSLASAAWGAYIQDFVTPEDFRTGRQDKVVFSNELGGLVLSKSMNCVPHLWVPSPEADTVSKIDARSGREVARYNIGPEGENWSPRAVAVDAEGNGYVACGSYTSIGKVVKILASVRVDSNRDGIVRTCVDVNSNGEITPAEVLPWGHDDAIATVVDVGSNGSEPASLVFDKQGYLWVSLYGSATVEKIDVVRGRSIASVELPCRPTSMVLGGRNDLWILSSQNSMLCQVDTVMNSVKNFHSIEGGCPENMCYDQSGRLWIADSRNGLLEYNTAYNVWNWHLTSDQIGYTSVTVDSVGDLWLTCPGHGEVVQLAGENAELLSVIKTGGIPHRICQDEDGYLWVMNRHTDTVLRIDPIERKCVVAAKLNSTPDSSTPFTAFTVQKGMSPEGSWRLIADSEINGAAWGKITWESIESVGRVQVDVRTGNTYDELANSQFIRIKNNERFDAPDGRYIELRITLECNTNATPVLQALRIEGINKAPDVSGAAPTVARILHTENGLESVGVCGIVDPEGDSYQVTILEVTQDEPVAGLDENDAAPDAIGVGSSTVWLREECAKGCEEISANGRVYTVKFKATDCWGASSIGKVKVTVPTSPLPDCVAVDDGQEYDSAIDPYSLVAVN